MPKLTVITFVLAIGVIVLSNQNSVRAQDAVSLDGKAAPFVVMGPSASTDKILADDIVFVGDAMLRMQTSGSFELVSDTNSNGTLCVKSADGKLHHVWAHVFNERGPTGTKLTDPLSSLSNEERAGLWGVTVDVWTDELADELHQLDLAKTAIWLRLDRFGFGKNTGNDRIPKLLPSKVQHLAIGEDYNNALVNVADLKRFSELRTLSLELRRTKAFDGSALTEQPTLVALRLLAEGLSDTVLKKFSALRWLDLSYSEIKRIDSAAELKELRYLNVSQTGVTDLSALGALAHLTTLLAQLSPVSTLPKGELKELRQLDVFGGKVSLADAAEFRTAHPNCVVNHRYIDVLKPKLAGVTKLRVRSGGTCHRRPSEETTLVEITDQSELAKFIAMIAIDDTHSGFHCMCCGNPSLEFYVGDRVVVTLGYHHGKSLRWPGGWPTDAMMTASSREFINDWLDKHGVAGPNEEEQQQRRQEQAQQRRVDAWRAIFPAEVTQALDSAKSREEAVAAFDKIADKSERAAVLLRVLGADSAAWNASLGPEPFFEQLLGAMSKDVLSKAIEGLVDDADGAAGAARWLFSTHKQASISEDTLAKVLEKIALAGLTSPKPINRHRTISALGGMSDAVSLALLRRVLAGEIKPRELSAEEAEEPGGMVEYRPGDHHESETIVAHAALWLAKRRDKDSVEAIRKLAADAKGEAKKLFDEALAALK